ncbi:sensor histidine kinase [Lolliginicoccus suaedae]|uniref:sensor histidine kinase n=1 Tax=Lolliginicoccus suaedae TaxID=2605429 RepID=UPI0011EE1FA8|nr:ATP-binding protein [Lolliginicoccus suaedae]
MKSSERVFRFLALGMGAPVTLAVLASNPPLATQLSLARSWWATLAVIVLLVVPAVLAAGSFILPVLVLRRAASVLVTGQLVVLATVPLGFERGVLDYPVDWPLAASATPVVIAAATLSWRPVILLAYVPATAAGLVLTTWWLVADPPWQWFARLGVAIPLFGLVLAALSLSALRAARLLDRNTGIARREAAAASHARETAAERDRVDALVHDTVLSALLTGGRESAPGIVRNAARIALDGLDRLADPGSHGELATQDFLARIRAVTEGADAPIAFGATVASHQAVLSRDIARTLVDVVHEAVRNSIRHAGPDAQRSVDVAIHDDSVAITVTDDGVGFDLKNVSARRLGIEYGIRRRIAGIPGAAAHLESTPGSGTRLEIHSPTLSQAPASADPAGPPPEQTTATHLLGLRTPIAAGLGAIIVLNEAAQPFSLIEARNLVLYLTALLALAASTAAILVPKRDPLPQRPALAAASLVIIAAAACAAGFPGGGATTDKHLWAWPIITLALCVMVIRGRFLIAWAAAISVAAMLAAGHLDTGGVYIIRLQWNMLPLALFTLVALALRRQARRINDAHHQAVEFSAAQARAQARIDERDQQSAYLAATARPLLQRMREAGRLSAAEQEGALQVEATLRDRIRGRILASAGILEAASAARERGAEVNLLDDGALDTAGPDTVARVQEAALAELERASGGRLTVRVLPPGRHAVCTIVHDDGVEVRRTEVPYAATRSSERLVRA